MEYNWFENSNSNKYVLKKDVPIDDLEFGVPIYLFYEDRFVEVIYDSEIITKRKIINDNNLVCNYVGVLIKKLPTQKEVFSNLDNINECSDGISGYIPYLTKCYNTVKKVGSTYCFSKLICYAPSGISKLDDYAIFSGVRSNVIIDLINSIHEEMYLAGDVFTRSPETFIGTHCKEFELKPYQKLFIDYMTIIEKNLNMTHVDMIWFDNWKSEFYDFLAKKFPEDKNEIENCKLRLIVNKLTA